MAARRPFWKWHRWKSIGFCLWPPSICIWNLKLKFQSKLDLCSGNHVVYRQTDRRTDGRTRWIQYTPPPTSLGGGINMFLLPEVEEIGKNMTKFENGSIGNSTTICKLVDLIPALHQSDCRIPNWVSAKTVLSCSTNHGQTTARFRSFFR